MRIARRRFWFSMTQQRLDGSDMGLAFEQMGGEAVAQRMQRHALPDPRSVGRFMEQAVELASGDRPASNFSAGKQPTFRQRYSSVVPRGTRLPPLSQQAGHFLRQHHIAVLAALR